MTSHMSKVENVKNKKNRSSCSEIAQTDVLFEATAQLELRSGVANAWRCRVFVGLHQTSRTGVHPGQINTDRRPKPFQSYIVQYSESSQSKGVI